MSNDVIFAVLKLTYKENEAKDTTPFCWYGICATTYIAAMLASNKALQWVNYPTQVGLNIIIDFIRVRKLVKCYFLSELILTHFSYSFQIHVHYEQNRE